MFSIAWEKVGGCLHAKLDDFILRISKLYNSNGSYLCLEGLKNLQWNDLYQIRMRPYHGSFIDVSEYQATLRLQDYAEYLFTGESGYYGVLPVNGPPLFFNCIGWEEAKEVAKREGVKYISSIYLSDRNKKKVSEPIWTPIQLENLECYVESVLSQNAGYSREQRKNGLHAVLANFDQLISNDIPEIPHLQHDFVKKEINRILIEEKN